MKKIVAVVFLLFATSVCADTPVGPMNYQGRLLDNAGVPVTGSYNFVVRVYDAASAGTLKYQENHNAVAVDDGVYNFLVGTQTKSGGDSTWSVELWNCCASLFMEIVVNGEALSPRHRLAAAPYAFQANLALTTNNALALGGKTAGQYNSLLEEICVSGKGKWLGVIGKCMGIGAVLNGYAQWSDLDNDADGQNYQNLDLTKSNLTGTNFSGAGSWTQGADFSGSTFKDATVTLSGFSKTNLQKTVWDNVVLTDAGVIAVTANLKDATIKNMNLSKWNLSGMNTNDMRGLSAAYLTACPAGLPAGWSCLAQASPANGKYFLVGPYANLSSTSALAINNAGARQLDVHQTALFGVSLDFTGVNFSGVTFFHQDVQTANMAYANFEHAKFVGNIVRVWSPGFPQGINFKNTDWYDAWLDFPDVESDNLQFDNAHFNNSRINLPRVNAGSSNIFSGFSNALLQNSQLTGGAGNELKFRDVVFNNVYVNVATTYLDIQGAQFMGKFAIANAIPGTWVEDNDFVQVELEGDFSQWDFSGNRLKYVEFDGNFSSTDWSSNEFDTAEFGYTFNGATMAGNGNTVTGLIRWVGTCPSGSAPVNQGCSVSW